MLRQAHTYIVRIYRRDGEAGKELAGIVEIVRSGRRLRFDSFDELRTILAMPSYLAGKSRSSSL